MKTSLNQKIENNLAIKWLLFTSLFLGFCFFLALPNFINLPDFSQFSKLDSNKNIIFESKASSFWVEVNSLKTYSTYKDGVNIINFGRLSGKNTFNYGGYIDFGIYKLESSKNKKIDIEREYIASNALVDIKRYYPKEKTESHFYTVKVENTKEFVLENDYEVLFDSTKNGNKCIKDNENIKCPLTFASDTAKLNLFLDDKKGNKVNIADNVLTSLIPITDFKCEYKDISITSNLSCRANKRSKVTLINSNYTISMNPNENYNFPYKFTDGKNQIMFKILDDFGFESNYQLELNSSR
jgi:hypothetical protein